MRNSGLSPTGTNWACFGKIVTYWVKVLVFSIPSFITHSIVLLSTFYIQGIRKTMMSKIQRAPLFKELSVRSRNLFGCKLETHSKLDKIIKGDLLE